MSERITEKNYSPKQLEILNALRAGEASFWPSRTIDSLIQRGAVRVLDRETQNAEGTKGGATTQTLLKLVLTDLKQKQQYSRADAGYRVALKRIIRAAIGGVDSGTRTIFLEIAVKRIALASPAVVARGLESWFEQAAKAWERGNNSGNERGLKEGEDECERQRNCAERVLALWKVEVDYPGLYPSFSYKGAGYHDCLSLMQAIARTEVA